MGSKGQPLSPECIQFLGDCIQSLQLDYHFPKETGRVEMGKGFLPSHTHIYIGLGVQNTFFHPFGLIYCLISIHSKAGSECLSHSC